MQLAEAMHLLLPPHQILKPILNNFLSPEEKQVGNVARDMALLDSNGPGEFDCNRKKKNNNGLFLWAYIKSENENNKTISNF